MLNRFSRLDVFLALSLMVATQAFPVSFYPSWGLTSLALGMTVMRWQMFHPVDPFQFTRYTLHFLLRRAFSGALLGIASNFWNESLPVLHVLAALLAALAIGLFISSAFRLSRMVNTSWCGPRAQGTA